MKKAITLTLVLTMLFTLLSACGNNKANETQTPTANPTAAPSESAAVTEEPDLYPLVDEEVEFSLMTGLYTPNTAGIINDWGEHPIYLAAEEITGIHIDFISVSTEAVSEQMSIRINSGDYPDMFAQAVMYSGAGIDYMVEEEILVNLTEYLQYMPNLSGIIEEYPAVLKDMSSDAGNIASTYSLQVEDITTNAGFLVRQDLMDESGLTTPATYSELHDVLTAFKVNYDMAAPLQLDEYGLMGDLANGMNAKLSISNPGTGINGRAFYQVDDVVKFGFMEPEYEAYVTMLNQWYNDGLFIDDILLTTNAISGELAPAYRLNGQSGVFQAQAADAESLMAMSDNESYKLAGIPTPTVNKGETVHVTGLSRSTQQREAYSVSTQCHDPELAVKWLDFWYSDTGYMLANYGIENESYTLDENGNAQWTDYIVNNPDGHIMRITLYVYTNPFLPCVADLNRTLSVLSDPMLEACDVWSANKDMAYQLPTGIALTTEESGRLSSRFTDIETYITESTAKFIRGVTPATESEFNAFRQTLVELGIEEYITIMQTAYERYLER